MIPPSARPLALIAALSLPGLALAAAPIPARISQAIHSQGFPAAAVSIVVQDPRSGETLLSLNPSEPRSPASTIKVLTTFAALSQLGPTYHWTTRAWTTAPVVDGRLVGDLVIEGGGDPFMSAERWWRFAQELRDRGLRQIEGDLVLDRTLYATQDLDPDQFDGRGYRTYNVLPDPLLVNLQAAEFRVRINGGLAEVVVEPAPANLQLDNALRVTQGRCTGSTGALSFTNIGDDPAHIAISGHVSANCPSYERRAIMRAPEFAFGTFLTYWRQLGGEFSGRLKLAPRPGGATLLAEYQSLTLAEIIPLVNKHSSNAMARMLLLTMAAERYGPPATVANGERALQAWLETQGLQFPELVLDNGSGLSRSTRISAQSMARLLDIAWQSRYWPEIAASVPLGGQDGTLRHRFVDLGAEARIRMKTGHLEGVGAIAGWVTARSGRPLSVVVLINHPGAQYGGGEAVIDTVVRWAVDR
ncbi:MAG: D-alanyl-D-alanine carboxypeptidase/D-alanyl-D-alanine-endopeptidase [Pseudomonadota bacterium]